GWPGLVVAGLCFIVPAVMVVLVLAWLYERYSELPVTDSILRGVTPVVVAIIIQALWRLGRVVFKTWLLGAVALAAAAANYLGVGELVVLAGAGLVMLLVWAGRKLFQRGTTPAC